MHASIENAYLWSLVERKLGTINCRIKNLLNAAGFNSAVTIKAIDPDNIKEIELMAMKIPVIIKGLIPEDEKLQEVMDLYFDIFDDLEDFHFKVGDRILIGEIVKSIYTENCLKVPSKFEAANVVETPIGLLYTDKQSHLLNNPKERGLIANTVSTNLALDDANYERIRSFIVSCCAQGARAIWKKFETNNPAEAAFLEKYDVRSLDTYNAKVIVEMDDLKRALSTRKSVKVRVVCYCSPFGLSCNFRVTSKLLGIVEENQIGTTDSKDFIGTCELANLRRHLTSKHTGILRTEQADAALPANNEASTTGASVVNEIQMRPTTFQLETNETKIKILLTWIFDTPSVDTYLKDGKIHNITNHLGKMKLNGHLRILNNIDLSILKDCCTGNSWSMLQAFKEDRQHDDSYCFHCESDIRQGQRTWTCERCYKPFHTKCRSPKLFNDGANIACFDCYFA